MGINHLIQRQQSDIKSWGDYIFTEFKGSIPNFTAVSKAETTLLEIIGDGFFTNIDIRAQLANSTPENSTKSGSLKIRFYLDGMLKGTHTFTRSDVYTSTGYNVADLINLDWLKGIDNPIPKDEVFNIISEGSNSFTSTNSKSIGLPYYFKSIKITIEFYDSKAYLTKNATISLKGG